MASARMPRDPWRSQSFRILVGLQEEIAPAEEAFVVRKFELARPATNSSFSLNPAGTGRCGFIACTIDSGITMARVHEDIW